MPDIIQCFNSDHQEVKTMLKKPAADEVADDRDEIFEDLTKTVKTPAKFEEEGVCAVLTKNPGNQDIAFEAYDEHRHARWWWC